MWSIWVQTSNPLSVGLLIFVFIAPNALAGPLLGTFVDFHSKKVLMFVSLILQGLVSLAVALIFVLSLVPNALTAIYLLLFLLSMLARIFFLSFFASVPNLVDKTDLMGANSLLSISGNANYIAGFSIGGIIVSILGPEIPIVYDSLTFFFAALMILSVSRASVDGIIKPESITPRSRPTLEGFKRIANDKLVMSLTLTMTALSFLGMSFYLFVIVGIEQIENNPVYLGLSIALLSVGEIVGSVLIARWNPRHIPGRVIVSGIVIGGFVCLTLSISPYLLLDLVLIGAFGCTVAMANISIDSLLQAGIPSSEIGRVMGSGSVMWSVAGPVGSLFGAFMLERFTLEPSLILVGILFVLVAIGASLSRSLLHSRY